MRSFLLLLFSTIGLSLYGQIISNDVCSQASKICGYGNYEVVFDLHNLTIQEADICFPSGSILENYSVLKLAPITKAGNIRFTITPSKPDADIDFLVFEGDCANLNLIRCMASGSSGFTSGINCSGPTGLNEFSTDFEEKEGCLASDDNFLAQLDATIGSTYVILINNLSNNGNANLSLSGDAKFGDGGILTQPTNIAQCLNDDNLLNVNIGGVGKLFQWQVALNRDSVFSNINGAVNVNYKPNSDTIGILYYRVSIIDALSMCKEIISNVVSVTNTNCNEPICGDGFDVIVTENSNISNNNKVCIGESATITATGGLSYIWSNGSTSNSIVVSPLISTTYSVTIFGADNCQKTFERAIIVEQCNCTTNAGLDKTINCNISSVQIGEIPVPNVIYSWSPSYGLTNANISNPIASPIESTEYTLTSIHPNGCIAIDKVLVIVDKNNPAANAGPDKLITCLTPNVQLGSPNLPQNDYLWLPSFGLSNSVIANPIATPEAQTTYILKVTNANGCFAFDTVTVEINKSIPFADAGQDKNISCLQPTTSIGTAAINGYKYVWSNGSTLSSNVTAQPIASPLSTQNYILSVTDTVNGCMQTDIVTVTYDNNIQCICEVNAGRDTTVNCVTNSVEIGQQPGNGVSYSWAPSVGLSANNIANPIANPIVTTQYILTAEYPSGCIARDTILVEVNKAKPIANAGDNRTLNCVVESVQIGGGTFNNSYSYLWTPALGLNNPILPFPYATAANNYILKVTDTNNGCFSLDTVIISLNRAYPEADAGPDKSISCTFPTTKIGTTKITGNSYLWSNGGSLDNNTFAQPVASPFDSTTYILTVTSNLSGCKSYDTVVVNSTKEMPYIDSVFHDTVCGPGIVELSVKPSSPTATVKWYDQGYGGSSVFTGLYYKPNITSTKSYFVEVNDGVCLGSGGRYSVQGTVKPVPTITSVIPATACSLNGQASMTLSAYQDFGTVEWYTRASGGTKYGQGNNLSLNVFGSSVSYVQAIFDGCVSTPRQPVTATVITEPQIQTVNNGTTCGSGPVTLSATANVPTINWYTSETSGTPFFSGKSCTTPNLSATTTYYVDASNPGCPNSAKVAVVAEIRPVPQAPRTQGNIICGSGDFNMSATVALGTLYWYTYKNGGSYFHTGPTYTESVINNFEEIVKTYYVGSTYNGCSSDRQPVASLSIPKSSVDSVYHGTRCGPGSVVLRAVSNQFVEWYDSYDEKVGEGETYSTPFLNKTSYYYAKALPLSSCDPNGTRLVEAAILNCVVNGSETNLQNFEVITTPKTNLILYPNPTDGNIFARFNNLKFFGLVTIRIRDVGGRVIYETKRETNEGENNIELDTQEFGKGLYILELIDGVETYFGKFIKS